MSGQKLNKGLGLRGIYLDSNIAVLQAHIRDGDGVGRWSLSNMWVMNLKLSDGLLVVLR